MHKTMRAQIIPYPEQVTRLPDVGAARQLEQTLRTMSALVAQGRGNMKVRTLAQNIVARVPPKNYRGEVASIHKWVRDSIRYTRDIHGIETLHTTDRILESRQGDCDDKSILLAALCESVGHPTRFVAAGFRGNPPSHVYPEVLIRGRWTAADATEPVGLGWVPPNITSKIYIANSPYAERATLAGKKARAAFAAEVQRVTNEINRLQSLLQGELTPEARQKYESELKGLFDYLERYDAARAVAERKKSKGFFKKVKTTLRKLDPIVGRKQVKRAEAKQRLEPVLARARTIELKLQGPLTPEERSRLQSELNSIRAQEQMFLKKQAKFRKFRTTAKIVAATVLTAGAAAGALGPTAMGVVHSAAAGIGKVAMAVGKGLMSAGSAMKSIVGMLVSKGMPQKQAEQVAEGVVNDPESWADLLAKAAPAAAAVYETARGGYAPSYEPSYTPSGGGGYAPSGGGGGGGGGYAPSEEAEEPAEEKKPVPGWLIPAVIGVIALIAS